ncbi:MAG: AAA family ATPase [Anaerolineae bacterium]|nr:AAA family ATPase [Anaerolineae bacterium]
MMFPKNTRRQPSDLNSHVQARLLALVGMPGSGKSMLARHLQDQGFPQFRFGSITMDEIARRGWEVTPQNEKIVREEIRRDEGMDAYAKRALPIIHAMLQSHNSAIIDGLYSFSEWKTLKGEFGAALVVVAVTCDRAIRYTRLGSRPERPLTAQEAEWRDITEIETLEKGGPIAIADYTILNNAAPESTIAALEAILGDLHLRP